MCPPPILHFLIRSTGPALSVNETDRTDLYQSRYRNLVAIPPPYVLCYVHDGVPPRSMIVIKFFFFKSISPTRCTCRVRVSCAAMNYYVVVFFISSGRVSLHHTTASHRLAVLRRAVQRAAPEVRVARLGRKTKERRPPRLIVPATYSRTWYFVYDCGDYARAFVFGTKFLAHCTDRSTQWGRRVHWVVKIILNISQIHVWKCTQNTIQIHVLERYLITTQIVFKYLLYIYFIKAYRFIATLFLRIPKQKNMFFK